MWQISLSAFTPPCQRQVDCLSSLSLSLTASLSVPAANPSLACLANPLPPLPDIYTQRKKDRRGGAESVRRQRPSARERRSKALTERPRRTAAPAREAGAARARPRCGPCCRPSPAAPTSRSFRQVQVQATAVEGVGDLGGSGPAGPLGESESKRADKSTPCQPSALSCSPVPPAAGADGVAVVLAAAGKGSAPS